MSTRTLRLRWSWRDLRQRWVQVAAIAVILALGTGIYAALGSTATWRRSSNDASFAATNLHDVKVRLATGTTAPEGSLVGLVADLAAGGSDPSGITAAEERLVWPTQFEVGVTDGSVLVGGELVGAHRGATIDRSVLRAGTEPADAGGGLLELNFARARGLASSGTLSVGGGERLWYSGTALSPEYFYLLPPTGELLAQGNQATVFVDLATAQRLAGQVGAVNDLVVTVASGTSVERVHQDLADALARRGLTGEVTTRDDEPAYRVLYTDIGNDQQIWNLVSLLILLGASFAAFNLVSRIVEAQRREIGIGMALGAPAHELALRPLLVGFQIALLGVLGGIGVGLAVAAAMRSLLDTALPLPIWRTPFQVGPFLVAATVGLLLPFLATAIPVWRAVRVEPVEAIRTGRAATARPGWARLGAGWRWPRGTLRMLPIRTLLRVPRRTLLTALAIAASTTVLVAVFGMLDSFGRTIDRGDRELTRTGAERVSVQLETFEPVDGPTMTRIAALDEVGTVVPGLMLPAEVVRDGHDPLSLIVEVVDFQRAPWTPTVASGDPPGPTTGILLSEKAAHDLGVGPGDRVVLRHLVRDGESYTTQDTAITVAGTHRLPLRPFAYLDASQAGVFGLDGFTNRAQVLPASGTSANAAQRALFGVDGVGSSVLVGDAGKAWDDALASFTGILRVMQVAVLALALLIAFNASSISVDERAREHATMFAFGVPRRSVLAMNVVESAIIGVLGTLIGLLAGYVVVVWVFTSLIAQTVPDIGIEPYLAPATLVTLFVLSVGVVAAAPLLTVRRLRRMDIPATLRVVE